MDGQQFDSLLKMVAAGGSRRRMLQGLLGGILGVGAMTALQPRPVTAAWNRRYCQYNCPSGAIATRCGRCPGSCPASVVVGGEECRLCHYTPCNLTKRECRDHAIEPTCTVT
jgi:hypothetical protein